jgi:uncharacterized OB-fold protein
VTATSQRLIDADLFTAPPDPPRLVGSRCPACGAVTFPRQQGCPRCNGDGMETITLGERGTLWTFTTQEYPLKEPYRLSPGATFEPFVLGYVELPDGVMVETRISESDPARLRIGMAMELEIVPLYTDGDGTEVLTFAFAPARES